MSFGLRTVRRSASPSWKIRPRCPGTMPDRRVWRRRDRAPRCGGRTCVSHRAASPSTTGSRWSDALPTAQQRQAVKLPPWAGADVPLPVPRAMVGVLPHERVGDRTLARRRFGDACLAHPAGRLRPHGGARQLARRSTPPRLTPRDARVAACQLGTRRDRSRAASPAGARARARRGEHQKPCGNCAESGNFAFFLNSQLERIPTPGSTEDPPDRHTILGALAGVVMVCLRDVLWCPAFRFARAKGQAWRCTYPLRATDCPG